MWMCEYLIAQTKCGKILRDRSVDIRNIVRELGDTFKALNCRINGTTTNIKFASTVLCYLFQRVPSVRCYMAIANFCVCTLGFSEEMIHFWSSLLIQKLSAIPPNETSNFHQNSEWMLQWK